MPKLEDLNEYLKEMAIILKNKYRIVEKGGLRNNDPIYQEFLADEKFHRLNRKFSDGLLRFKDKGKNVEGIEGRYDSLISLIDSHPLNSSDKSYSEALETFVTMYPKK